MSRHKSYFDRVYDRRLIHAPMTGFKMRVFMRLYNLSAAAFAKPKSAGDMDDSTHGGGNICALEARAKYVVKRLALLNRCNDDDEMRFLDYYARWDKDILRDIDNGVWEFKYARRMINAALLDICNSLKGKSHD